MMRALAAALLIGFVLVSPARAEERAARPIHPALFVATDADSKIYLFGAIHVRRRGAPWGGPEAQAALAESQEVWTELEMSPEADARAASEVVQMGMAPADRPLSSYLTPEQMVRVRAVIAQLDIPEAYFERMKPWLAGLMFSLLPITRAGYDPNSGVDRQIDADANRAGKTMRWFETSAQQLSFFSGMSDEMQIEMLMEAVDGANETANDLRDLESAWERGDVRRLERVVIDETRDDYPELYDVVFARRNRAWTDVLMHEMEGAGVDFVAVGAGHLLGPDGLVAQLRARGVRVTRVRAVR